MLLNKSRVKFLDMDFTTKISNWVVAFLKKYFIYLYALYVLFASYCFGFKPQAYA